MDARGNLPLVILGSNRKESDTRCFVEAVFKDVDYNTIDLSILKIASYDYSGTYPPEDQYSEIVDAFLGHEVIVFATPVYWYAMSGLMKTLFDRFTDLVTIKKQQGRALKGKRIYLLAVGADEMLPAGFEVPFSYTADYLGMKYSGCIYYSTKYIMNEEELQSEIDNFLKSIQVIQ